MAPSRRRQWLESESSEYEDEGKGPGPDVTDQYVSSDEEPTTKPGRGAAGLDLFSRAFDGDVKDERKRTKQERTMAKAPTYIGVDGSEVPESARAERHDGIDKTKMMKGLALHQRSMTKCGYCPESDKFRIHRASEIFSMNNNIEGCYLAAVGWKQAVHKYHFRIIPLPHRPSIVTLEAPTNEYLRNYQKLVVHFFERKGLIPLFIETAQTTPSKEALLLGGGHHVTIEVIPIPHDRLEDAKLSFRESLLSAGEEWSQNPKLISTNKEDYPTIRFPPKGIIPENIPYVHVDFGLGGGFAHVIEKKSDFEIDNVDITGKFLREVAISILGLSVFDRAFKSELEWRRSLRLFREDWKKLSGDSDVLVDESKDHPNDKALEPEDYVRTRASRSRDSNHQIEADEGYYRGGLKDYNSRASQQERDDTTQRDRDRGDTSDRKTRVDEDITLDFSDD